LSKTENELKTALIKDLRNAGWYARRLEDQFAVGLMDMLVCIPYGPTVAIEAKRIAHQTFAPTPRQYIELERFAAHSITDMYPPRRFSWLLGFQNGLMYLHPLAKSAKIEDCLEQLPGEHPTVFIKRFLQCQTTAQ
jgi:hypothetical protein